VVHIAELSPSISDEQVLEEANRRGALLLTLDKDFGELVFRQGRISSGVLLIRLAGLGTEEKQSAVSSAIRLHGAELLGSFSVIDSGKLRIRRRF
jgi:predicted nuclease of predicted toxin-antitoxin system